MAEKTRAATRHDEVMSDIRVIKDTLLARKHLDELIIKNYEFINGNGKPGAKSQLNTLMWWNRAVIVVLVINILSNWASM